MPQDLRLVLKISSNHTHHRYGSDKSGCLNSNTKTIVIQYASNAFLKEKVLYSNRNIKTVKSVSLIPSFFGGWGDEVGSGGNKNKKSSKKISK